MFSWPAGTGEYRFAVIPAQRYQRFITSFTPDMRGIEGIESLRVTLRRLPPGSTVAWTDAECFGITLPQPRYVDHVMALLKKDGVDLELNPGVCE